MAATPEGAVKQRVKALLDKHAAYWFMPMQNGYGAPSLDFLICHRGRFAACETKAGNKKPTPRQELTIKQIQRAMGPCFVVNEESGLDALRLWLEAGE